MVTQSFHRPHVISTMTDVVFACQRKRLRHVVLSIIGEEINKIIDKMHLSIDPFCLTQTVIPRPPPKFRCVLIKVAATKKC